jgi:hypothetical protein
MCASVEGGEATSLRQYVARDLAKGRKRENEYADPTLKRSHLRNAMKNPDDARQ